MNPPFERILITGAAGKLGSQLRRGLAPLARKLRLHDRVAICLIPSRMRRSSPANSAISPAMLAAVEGVDAIVHFGGAALEAPWEAVLSSNIVGSYNIFEAARRQGARRVVYASSVHAIGYHEVETHIDANAPHRPDSLYGVSKCFVEDLGRLYWDKFGLESAHLRIFSSYPEPAERRMLWSWLSFADCVRLVAASLTAARVGHTDLLRHVRQQVETRRQQARQPSRILPAGLGGAVSRRGRGQQTCRSIAKAPSTRYLGGWFVDLGHPDDEVKK